MEKIENVLGSVLQNIDKNKKNDVEEIRKIFFSNIDVNIRSFLEMADVTDGILWILINNSIIFSEVVCFRKKYISENVLNKLSHLGINEIRYRLK